MLSNLFSNIKGVFVSG